MAAPIPKGTAIAMAGTVTLNVPAIMTNTP